MTEELKKLQDDMALIDLLTRNIDSSMIEVLLKKMLPIQIRMEQDNNHSMPHVHITYNKDYHTASYSIEDGERIVGNLKNKYDKVVKSWITANHKKLLQIWVEVQAGDNNAYDISIGQL